MVELWDQQLILAKYHLSVANRLRDNFSVHGDKRLIIAIINEMAICSSHLINSYLLYFHVKFNMKISKLASERLKTLERGAQKGILEIATYNSLVKIIEIKKAQKKSPVEYRRNTKILLINKEYISISIDDINKMLSDLEKVIKEFPN